MFDMKLFRIQKIVKDAGFGASAPIIIQADNKEYVLKTQEDGGMQPKSVSIFNELLAYQLIDYLDYNISPQEVVFLVIDENFVEMAKIAYDEGIIKEDSYENISSSLGINLGIEYLHHAMEALDDIENDTFVKDLVHIDNYIMNCDRTKDNPNILQDKNNLRRYYAIDFGNALSDGLLYDKIVEKSIDIFSITSFYECNVTLSNRYILKDKSKNLIKKGRKNIDNVSKIRLILSDIIDLFPPNWEAIKSKDDIIDVIAIRLKSRNIFNIENSSKCECEY